MRLGEASMMRCTTFLDRPARGGSTTSSIRAAGALEELGQGRAGVAGEEVDVGDLVAPRAGDRVGDGLLEQLDPPQLARARGERERDRADPRVQVVHALPALQRRVLGDHAVQQLGHLGVRLEERLGGDQQVELAQALGQLGLAPHQLGLATGGRLGEAVRARPQHAAEALAELPTERRRERAGVQLSLGGHDPDLQPAGVPAFAHDQVAQARAPVGRRPRPLVARGPSAPIRSSAPTRQRGVACPRAARRLRRPALAATAFPRGQPLGAAPAQRGHAREVPALGRQQAVLDRRHPIAAGGGVEAAHQLGAGSSSSPKEYSSLLR